jgi:hypothetical protein
MAQLFTIDARRTMFAMIATKLVLGSDDPADFAGMTPPSYSFTDEFLGEIAVAPKLGAEALTVPGVNVICLPEIDTTPNRMKTKRYRMPVLISVVVPLSGLDEPIRLEAAVRRVTALIDERIRTGFADILDFSTSAPYLTGRRLWWHHNSALTWNDLSLPEEGGDIRLEIILQCDFTEPTT